ncbi:MULTISPECIES: hypothetical protein [unclassified Acinetobacter]|uniref:hypothetical protein n=1 Tax=unclassified Acinetobacter TaxID=196816 RepID=UPI0035B93475
MSHTPNIRTQQLTPLIEIVDDGSRLLKIKREQLVPLFDIARQQRIFEIHYADSILQAQHQQLDKIHLALIPSFAENLSKIMQLLQHSEPKKPKKINRLQRWLGQDIEYQAKSLATQQQLKRLVDRIKADSTRLQQQQQQSEQSVSKLHQLRLDMAYHIVALQQFIQESEQFALQSTSSSVQQLIPRLQQRVQQLSQAQVSTDMAMLQMLLNQDVATSLLQRVDELLQVLLPSWQHYLNAQHSAQNGQQLQKIHQIREQLLQQLSTAMRSFQATSNSSAPEPTTNKADFQR